MPRTGQGRGRGRGGRGRGACAIVGAFSLAVPFVLLSYYAFGHHPTTPSTLQLVSIVFRHGQRTPTHFYPNDPYKEPALWPDGFGALTTEGKLQMFRLGKLLRRRYAAFLSQNYSPDDIYVLSSDHDRCLMSAQLCLAGLYPPVGRQRWNNDLAWQPIPVHTVPRHLDKLIVVKKPCPAYDNELNRTYSTPHFAQVDRENADLYRYLTEHSGMRVDGLVQLEALYNTLEVEASLGMRLPAWAEEVLGDRTRDLAALSLAAHAFTDTTKRLKGGPILAEVVDHMTRKVLGSLQPDRLLYLYSAHDLTLISVLRALGFDELFKPDYGAALIFELHRPPDGADHLVQVAYLNNTDHSDVLPLTVPGCDPMCKLKDFLRITKPMIPSDWEAECLADSPEPRRA